MPSNRQAWLICGGREFTDRELFGRTMADLIATRGRPTKMVHGGASGADSMGRKHVSRNATRRAIARERRACRYTLYKREANMRDQRV
jgi:hypothetical protein